MTRRSFLRAAGYGMTALMVPGAFPRRALAAGPADPMLVAIFLRGGADSLNMVIPRGDPNYLVQRPTLNVAPDPNLDTDLDGYFDLHPNLFPLKALFDQGRLAVVHAVGRTDNYSHFRAMDAMEFVSPGGGGISNGGWLHNTLDTLRLQGDVLPVLTLKGISLASSKAQSLHGPGTSLSVAFPSVSDFVLTGTHAQLRQVELEQIYAAIQLGQAATTAREITRVAADSMQDALQSLGTVSLPDTGVAYGPYVSSVFRSRLRDTVALAARPDLGVRVVTIDLGGWDHHYNELNALAGRTRELANGLAAFQAELDSVAASGRVVTLVMTEFGRTAKQNGTGGTDHGYGTLMLALGAGVAGGRVVSRGAIATPGGGWPGLAPSQLHVQPSTGEQRDLAATTDFREVFYEVLVNHMGLDGTTEALPVVNAAGDFTVPSPGLGLFGI